VHDKLRIIVVLLLIIMHVPVVTHRVVVMVVIVVLKERTADVRTGTAAFRAVHEDIVDVAVAGDVDVVVVVILVVGIMNGTFTRNVKMVAARADVAAGHML
jgi:hypothetical protein